MSATDPVEPETSLHVQDEESLAKDLRKAHAKVISRRKMLKYEEQEKRKGIVSGTTDANCTIHVHSPAPSFEML